MEALMARFASSFLSIRRASAPVASHVEPAEKAAPVQARLACQPVDDDDSEDVEETTAEDAREEGASVAQESSDVEDLSCEAEQQSHARQQEPGQIAVPGRAPCSTVVQQEESCDEAAEDEEAADDAIEEEVQDAEEVGMEDGEGVDEVDVELEAEVQDAPQAESAASEEADEMEDEEEEAGEEEESQEFEIDARKDVPEMVEAEDMQEDEEDDEQEEVEEERQDVQEVEMQHVQEVQEVEGSAAVDLACAAQEPSPGEASAAVGGECSPKLLCQEVLQVFAHFEASGSDSLAADARTAARARIAALRRRRCDASGAFAAALESVADLVLEPGDTRAAPAVVESSLRLLAAVALDVEQEDGPLPPAGSPGCRLLASVAARFSDPRRAPRDRGSRLRAAVLLQQFTWELSARLRKQQQPPAGSSATAAAEAAASARAALLQLALDASPAVRQAAARGLAALLASDLLASADDVRRSLARLASTDAAAAVRVAALEGLAAAGAEGLTLAVMATRSLDVSCAVRRALFSALCKLFEEQDVTRLPAPRALAQLLLRAGLEDGAPEVRGACEDAACTWLRRLACSAGDGGSLDPEPLLHLLAALPSERAAEAVIRAALACQDLGPRLRTWASSYAFCSRGHGDNSCSRAPAAALLWRLALGGEVPAPELATQALHVARQGQGAQRLEELRQLLLALLQRPLGMGDSGWSPREAQEVASAAVLAAPLPTVGNLALSADGLDAGPSQSAPSLVDLAVALARRAASSSSQALPLDVWIASVLDRFRIGPGEAPSDGSSVDGDVDGGTAKGMRELGARLDALLAQAAAAGAPSAAPAKGRSAAARRRAAEKEASAAAAAQTALATAEQSVQILTLRVLGFAQAALRFALPPPRAFADEEEVDASSEGRCISDLVDDFLRPALQRADAVEAVCGSGSWALVRALTVRCLALYASAEVETAAAHGPFFQAVLQRFAPLAAAAAGEQREVSDESTAAAIYITEACVDFLADSCIQYQGQPGIEGCGFHNTGDLLAVLARVIGMPGGGFRGDRPIPLSLPAALLAPPARRAGADDDDSDGEAGSAARRPEGWLATHVSQERAISLPRLPTGARWRLSRRLCALLLCGGCGDDGGGGDLPSPSVLWALGWLLVEAFCVAPAALYGGDASSADSLREGNAFVRAAGQLEAAAEADHRGRLLGFFGCLGRASTLHARLLAGAAEILLSSDLWRLGLSALVAGRRRCCLVHLPRLVRLLSRQLISTFSAAPAGSDVARRLVEHWMESLWRPLALLCLEERPLSDEESLCLPEALLAALTVASDAAAEWQIQGCLCAELFDEVARTTTRVLETWAAAGVTAGAGHGRLTTALSRQLVRLTTVLRGDCAAAESDDSVDQDLLACARARRGKLREELCVLGVDVEGIVIAAWRLLLPQPSPHPAPGGVPSAARLAAPPAEAIEAACRPTHAVAAVAEPEATATDAFAAAGASEPLRGDKPKPKTRRRPRTATATATTPPAAPLLVEAHGGSDDDSDAPAAPRRRRRGASGSSLLLTAGSRAGA